MLLGRSLKLLDLTLGCAVQHQQTTTQQATEMQFVRCGLQVWYRPVRRLVAAKDHKATAQATITDSLKIIIDGLAPASYTCRGHGNVHKLRVGAKLNASRQCLQCCLESR
ncbi:hypothetical protein ABBQ38_013369 [Trebouxia sp. C0009 RCD-2024]